MRVPNQPQYRDTVAVGKYEVTLTVDGTYGYMEHKVRGELGGLWIDNDVLVDYDGCFILPMPVVEALRQQGVTVPADCFDLN